MAQAAHSRLKSNSGTMALTMAPSRECQWRESYLKVVKSFISCQASKGLRKSWHSFQGDKKVWKIEKGQKKWGLAALAYSKSPHKVVCCFQGWEQRIMSAGLVSFLTLTIRVRVTGKSNTRLFVCREKLERQPTDCTAPVLSLQTSSSLFFHPWLLFSPLRHKLLYSA